MNVAPASTLKDATVQTEQGLWLVKIINEGNLRDVKQLDAINMRIANKETIDSLKEQGFIYHGVDGELHVIEQKNSTASTDQS